MSSIFISHRTTNGHSWTITSKLGHILRIAEKKYGPRDYTYTILGVELNQDGHPRIWYPGDCKNLVIQISMNCINDIDRAVFQVAHEAIHCLSPTGTNRANVLEEGLANLFSIEYTLANGNGIWTSNDQKYTDASELVKQLLSFDQEIIKKLRLAQPAISSIDKELILKTNSNVPENLAERLTVIF
ncbi:hypothetical protein [Pedobacter cryotolerans]|uniref:Uncharacterized protein n=1 Tax=Pedobacter cryotolerans TaxID=2571270 RepID=A0A4U1BV17_9SPHI|nr:hypothetical protein [Pedobacter cryotolerans]TKB96179.1 hypothetical protein FA045_18565 [Pedobacter cryotolerans]